MNDYEYHPVYPSIQVEPMPYIADSKIRALIRRDGLRCHYCRAWMTRVSCTKDHIVPRSKGGDNSLDNLVLACHGCNTRKGSQDYSDFIGDQKERDS